VYSAGVRRLLVPVLFILLWASTLTPLHRLYGFGQRTMIIGLVEGLALFIAAAIILTAARRRSLLGVVVATAAGWIALTSLTNAVEPARDRSTAARHASPPPATGPQSPDSRRVLLLCVDGLDWNALDQLIAGGSLPFLTQLISSARTYEVDNHGLALSPGIWARAYTGNAREPIQGFVKWSPRGTERDIAILPLWRHRPVLMLDRVLTAGSVLHLWDTLSTSNADFVHPPLWRVASAARARVGVFDPLPFDVLGEQVNGFFLWQADDGFRLAASNGGARPAVERIRDDTSSTSMDSVIHSEGLRAEIAARAFARERPDIGIYYTHVLDAVGHMIWEPAATPDVGEARAERTRALTAGRVAAAYRAVDDALKKLADSFGPAAVVVVSDHGWEFNAYAHRTAPLGTAIIAGTGAKGYGGVIPVESVAATVLALAQVPVSPTMADPIREVAPHWTTCTECATVPPTFLPSQGGDTQRRNRLRSLGYITK
jgi:hypothetical protein